MTFEGAEKYKGTGTDKYTEQGKETSIDYKIIDLRMRSQLNESIVIMMCI